jgi:cytidyltransferase-like protein
MEEKLIIVSGYFNPLHKGHLELFKKANELAGLNGRVMVIVNSDLQRELKGSKEFMNEDERLEIVKAIKYVNFAMLSIDTDRTQCKTLEHLAKEYKHKHLIFANGGDQNNNTIPERDVCETYGIELIDGLGNKIQSSSWLLKDN